MLDTRTSSISRNSTLHLEPGWARYLNYYYATLLAFVAAGTLAYLLIRTVLR